MVYTKEILRTAFWELLEEKPYSKITVQEIVDFCHVNRNTFYYHFQDIPTLMVDSVENWIEDVLAKYGADSTPISCFAYVAREMMARKQAFLHLFQSIHKDAFLADLNRMGYSIVRMYMERFESVSALPKDEREILIHGYKCLFTGILLDWLEDNASYDLVEFAQNLHQLFPVME
ncbi:MAG: TetR/AcrR family transcriptional regulator C-terminal domain-containing protein [Eubacteriales bacterium]|nr:TetR/AcrR family transcriptional regulator C-terminal domain-containing protein [Eubacteriales bacterium]